MEKLRWGNTLQLPILVAKPQHIGKCRNLLLSTLHFRRFLKIPLGTDVPDYTLSVQSFLKTSESTLHGLALSYFNFYWHLQILDEDSGHVEGVKQRMNVNKNS